jgi:hypothetical protein
VQTRGVEGQQAVPKTISKLRTEPCEFKEAWEGVRIADPYTQKEHAAGG